MQIRQTLNVAAFRGHGARVLVPRKAAVVRENQHIQPAVFRGHRGRALVAHYAQSERHLHAVHVVESRRQQVRYGARYILAHQVVGDIDQHLAAKLQVGSAHVLRHTVIIVSCLCVARLIRQLHQAIHHHDGPEIHRNRHVDYIPVDGAIQPGQQITETILMIY